MSTDAAWKAFLRPLSTSETAQVIEDLFDAGLALLAASYGPCLAPVNLVLQASPPRVTSAAAEPNFAGLSSYGERELIKQVGWAWLTGWAVSLSPCDGDALRRLASKGIPMPHMPADAWAWCVRALDLTGNPFESMAEARAAIPS